MTYRSPNGALGSGTRVRIFAALGTLIVLTCIAACGGGPKLVKETDMQKRAKVESIARSTVHTRVNRDPHITSLAIIGVTSGRGTNGSNKSGVTFDPTGISSIVARVDTVKNAQDMAKLTSCRALDAAFDSMSPALEAAGIHSVAAAEKLAKDDYARLLEHSGTPVCAVKQARVSMVKLLGVSMNAHKPGEGKGLIKYQQDLKSLIDDLGVDGVLLAYLSVNKMTANGSSLVLLAKQPDGSVEAVWQGDLRASKIKFQPVAKSPKGDDDHVQNVARVYKNEFELLAAKLATDLKK